MEMMPWDRTIIMGYSSGWKLLSRGWQGVRPAPKDIVINELF